MMRRVRALVPGSTHYLLPLACTLAFAVLLVTSLSFQTPPVVADHDETQQRGRDRDDDEERRKKTFSPQPGWDEEEGIGYDEDERERDSNIVRINNRQDDRLRTKGNVQLNRIRGDYVEPENMSFAYASCVDCQTVAVALQINLYNPDAQYIAPQNAAVAVNHECTRCRTVAVAIQYVYAIHDPDEVPEDARSLIREMDRELRDIQRSERRISLEEAEARLNAVIAQFQSLAARIDQTRDEKVSGDAPTGTEAAPTPTPTATTGPATSSDPVATPTQTSTSVPGSPESPPATPTPTATPSAPPESATPSTPPETPTPTSTPVP